MEQEIWTMEWIVMTGCSPLEIVILKNIMFLEPPEYDEVLKLLEKYLYPSLSHVGYDPQFPDDWNQLFLRMMKRGKNLSYIAVDIKTGEVAAVRMVDLVEKELYRSQWAFPLRTRKTLMFFELCGDICKGWDIFETFNITEYADMFGLTVDEKYRRRGLATEMYRRGLNYLQRRGIKIVKCSFISPFTRRAGHKHGYKEHQRRYFHDCKNKEGEILNPAPIPQILSIWIF
ncbi:Dopamine N-acetyltransferase [Orchesella cincta]|uniref:Dopamine N-acetyltransferase n=1 Tax=Orchesella cincta TaxID=48709 RepID=A0A1D2M5T7_ORCCI|nr:Dopamine N-acetyltransferase [Orchesella cincta]